MRRLDPASLPGLPSVIGPERLGPYLLENDNDLAAAIRLYSWNIEASSALLGAYAALEVGIRNALHDRLCRLFDRSDWWEEAPLTLHDRAQIDDAAGYLEKRRGNGAWTPGHLVAELKTSFWEGLLVNKYHASLWERGLDSAFPLYSGRRSALRERMERLRLLRNRAAHHEPVFARDLRIDHQYICELAGFVSLDLHEWIDSHSRLPRVIALRSATVNGTRQSRF